MLGRRKAGSAASARENRLTFECLESRVVLSGGSVATNLEVANYDHAVTAPLAALVIDVLVPALQYTRFGELTPLQVPLLSLQQVASIPNAYWLGTMSPAARAAFNAQQVQALKPATLGLDLLTAQQVSWLTTAQVQGLNFWDFPPLSAAQTPFLTPAQIASINNTESLAAWSATARAALTQSQVTALNVANVSIRLLTPQQISWLSQGQIAAVPFYDLIYLQPAQIPQVTGAQIWSIPNIDALAAWSPASRAALTFAQVQSLSMPLTQVTLLTSSQIAWLRPLQIQTVPFYGLQHLPPSQISKVTVEQIASINNTDSFAAWSAASRAALSQSQVQALNVANVSPRLLTSQQIGGLTAAQIRQLPYYDFIYMLPTQIAALSAAQLATIPNVAALAALSPQSRAAFTATQVQALPPSIISLQYLTDQQVAWLTTVQIRELSFWDFPRLAGAQAALLTTQQIASISSWSAFAAWSASSRWALGPAQVQALNVSVVSIGLLSGVQIGWLSGTQIQMLPYYDFARLQPAQIPTLTISQIASIPRADVFSSWWPPAVTAMTSAQVRALSMPDLPLQMLTNAQVSSLTTGQIQNLPYYNFQYLSPAQIPTLTTAQIRSIPTDFVLRAWSSESRAALTLAQIQALSMPTARIDWMSTQQIGWLTLAQLRLLAFYDFQYLQPTQISLLSPDQFESINTSDVLGLWSDPQQAAMTRAQLMKLPLSVFTSYTHSDSIAPPAEYQPVVDVPIGVGGLNNNAHTEAEWARVLALVPTSSITHATVASGNWTDPAIWSGGVVPRLGAKVLISSGTTVRFNTWMYNYAIDTLRIDGVLTFATNQGTQLRVDTIVVNTSGTLRIGTDAAPIQDELAARVVIVGNGPINTAKDPYLLGRGLVSRGTVEMYGKQVTPFVDLASSVAAGATQLVLAEVPVNWRVGDELVIAGTDPYVSHFRTDRVAIRAINGTLITVDPLLYSHEAPAGLGLSIQVANLTRNILFTAEDASVIAERPHMAFMHNPNVKISNIGVYGFGRTDKNVRINDPVVIDGVLQPGTGLNPRARYALHFHHAGVNPAVDPAVIRGSVVVDSPGWGYVNHQSNVVMENNVAFNVLGASFVTEDGNEIGVMRHNLALATKGSSVHGDRRDIHDFGFAGHGFWFQGPGIAVFDNISAGSGSAGFYYLTASSKVQFDAVNLTDPALAGGRKTLPVHSVSLNTFSGNTAYASGEGLAIWSNNFLMPDGQSVIDRFKSWNSRGDGISINYSGRILVKDSLLVGDLQRFDGIGIETNRWAHDLSVFNVGIVGFEIGIVPTQRRSTTINGGYVAAVLGLYVSKGQDTIRTLNVRGTAFPDLTSSQLRGRRQYDLYSTVFGLEQANDRSRNSLFSSDQIVFTPPGRVAGRLYFYAQSATAIPFPSSTAIGRVPNEYLDKTAQQLRIEFGLSFGGEMAPGGLTQLPDVYGLLRYR